MNKEHFLIELKIYLKPLSYQKQTLILEKYETIFEERLAAGQSEETIAKELGKPKMIAEKVLQEFDIEVPEKKLGRDGWQEFYPEKETISAEEFSDHTPPYADGYVQERTPHSPFFRFCQIAGILSLNFFLIIWVVFGALMGLLGVWIAAIAGLLSPIIGGYAVISSYNDGSMFQLFLSLFIFGGAIIALLVLKPLTTWFFRILKYYFNWTVSVLRGEV